MQTKSLAKRTISGIIYVALIIAAILIGQPGIIALAIIFGSLGIIELNKISVPETPLTFRIPAIICDLAALWCMLLWPIWSSSLLFLLPIFIARGILQIYLPSGQPLREISVSALSIFYIGIPMACMVLLTTFALPQFTLLAMFIMIWLNDTGAFIVGSLFGRHKLFERLSPKKSWEGFVGGLALNLIVVVVYYLLNSPDPANSSTPTNLWSLQMLIIFAITVTCFATWGDLFESMIKRNLQIKDSGNIIPGHGGILDRIDSLLFVAPATLILLLLSEV